MNTFLGHGYMNTLFVILISSSALVLSLASVCSFFSLLPSLSPVRVLPQSARWLLANDRREEAIALLRKAALVNGRVLPPAVQVCLSAFNSKLSLLSCISSAHNVKMTHHISLCPEINQK